MRSAKTEALSRAVTDRQRSVLRTFMWLPGDFKRRRPDMQEPSSHALSSSSCPRGGGHHQNRPHANSSRVPLDVRLELEEMSRETEWSTTKRKEQRTMKTNRPTYRALLARRGYLVRETLGFGAYSKVKMALDCSGFAKKVAVKIVDRSRVPRDYEEEFMPRELEIWPRLRHRNLVELREWFQNSKLVFMVLEYAEGGDLLNYIQSVGAINEPLARRWTFQAADAIGYLHQQDIAHRDLKLENILLDKNNNIKICDFGFIKRSPSKDLSRTYCGSKSYAAPEILLGRPYDPKKADLWALGVVLYIVVTGKMPFNESRGTHRILEAQRQLDFPWCNLCQVSAGCKALIHKLFTWGFEARPGIGEVLCDEWLAGPGTDAFGGKEEIGVMSSG